MPVVEDRDEPVGDAGPPKLDWSEVSREVTEKIRFSVAQHHFSESEVETIIANHMRNTYRLSWAEHTVKVTLSDPETNDIAATVEISKRLGK